MLKFVSAMEFYPKGIFRSSIRARSFNCDKERPLFLYPLRTTLAIGDFIKVFFAPDGDGHYLEKCCGKGNVDLNHTRGPFFALHGLVGESIHADTLSQRFSLMEQEGTWERDIYKPQMLLAMDEIEKYASNPFKTIYIRNFGQVDEKTINELKAAAEAFISNPVPQPPDICMAQSGKL